MKFIVAVGTLVEVVEETLRMCDNRPIAFQLKIKKELIELPGFLNERIFNENIVVGISSDVSRRKLTAEIVVYAVFRRAAQVDSVVAFAEFLFQLGKSGVKVFRLIFKSSLGYMGSRNDAADAPRLHTFHKVCRSLYVGRSVVNTGQDMAMDVGCKRELRRLGGF